MFYHAEIVRTFPVNTVADITFFEFIIILSGFRQQTAHNFLFFNVTEQAVAYGTP